MKIVIDTESGRLMAAGPAGMRDLPLYSPDGLEVLSRLWRKVAWHESHAASFDWLGQPINQLPDDLVRLHQVIHRVHPTVIVQTGTAHAGMILFSASLLTLLGGGRVIAVDAEIPPSVQDAVGSEGAAQNVSWIAGDVTGAETLQRVRHGISSESKVLVLLGSSRSKESVRRELEAYSPLVSVGSAIMTLDGGLHELHDVPRGDPRWKEDNPAQAVVEFAMEAAEFRLEPPDLLFRLK